MQYQLGMRQMRCISSVFYFYAGMAELGDALVLETSGLGRAGSIPASRTNIWASAVTGSRIGLKIRGSEMSVWVQVPPCPPFSIYHLGIKDARRCTQQPYIWVSGRGGELHQTVLDMQEHLSSGQY